MGRPPRKDKNDKVKVHCSFCGEDIIRPKYAVEKSKRKGHKPCCSLKCAGRLGGLDKIK